MLLTACASLTGALDAQAPMDKGRLGIRLTEVVKPWTGDLDGMAERRMVRVLTTYSRTCTSSTEAPREARPTTRASCSKRR